MAAEKSQFATETGTRNYKQLVDNLRAKLGNIPWTSFVDWVRAETGYTISKDMLYRGGRNSPTPSIRALFVLSKVSQFTFLDNRTHPDMDQLALLLLGEIDAFGQPIPREETHG